MVEWYRLGEDIFDFFFKSDDNLGSIGITSKSGSTSFSVSRTKLYNNDIAESSLTVSQEFKNETLSVSTSNTENPAFIVASNRFSNKNINIETCLQEPDISLNIKYAPSPYSIAFDSNINTWDAHAHTFGVSATYDFKDQNLLFGANATVNNEPDQKIDISPAFGLQYKFNQNILCAMKTDLKCHNIGLMYDKFRSDQNTLFAKLDIHINDKDDDNNNDKLFEYSVGFKRTINDRSSLDFVFNNDKTFGCRYNTDITQSGFTINGYITANFNFNPNQDRARLQYGFFVE